MENQENHFAKTSSKAIKSLVFRTVPGGFASPPTVHFSDNLPAVDIIPSNIPAAGLFTTVVIDF